MSVVAAVLAKQPFAGHIAVSILSPNTAQVFLFCFGEFIRIDELVIAGIVRWIDIDHLDLAEVCLLQNLQHFQVFAFDKDVFRIVKTNGFFRARHKSCGGGGLQHPKSVRLARPVQHIAFVLKFYILAQRGFQLFPVDFIFRERFG